LRKESILNCLLNEWQSRGMRQYKGSIKMKSIIDNQSGGTHLLLTVNYLRAERLHGNPA